MRRWQVLPAQSLGLDEHGVEKAYLIVAEILRVQDGALLFLDPDGIPIWGFGAGHWIYFASVQSAGKVLALAPAAEVKP